MFLGIYSSRLIGEFYYFNNKSGFMKNNQIQILPFFIITFGILISGFTVIFTWLVVFILPVRLRAQTKSLFLMNFATTAFITIISTVFFYMLFLVLGVGGIAKNRRAQGLDQSKGSDN